MFADEARSLPKSRSPEWYFTRVGSGLTPANITLGWKGLSGTNPLAYYEHLYIAAVKGFIKLGPSYISVSGIG
jgi:hypothetical protein